MVHIYSLNNAETKPPYPNTTGTGRGPVDTSSIPVLLNARSLRSKASSKEMWEKGLIEGLGPLASDSSELVPALQAMSKDESNKMQGSEGAG